MSQNNEELKHFGVPGMKWGVRRARKLAAKENVKGRSSYSTGKNYDKVYDELQKIRKRNNKKYNDEYVKLATEAAAYNNGTRDSKERDRLIKKNNEINNRYYKENMQIIKKFTDKFNEATLKDINYKDIEKGKTYLKKHNKIIFDVEL